MEELKKFVLNSWLSIDLDSIADKIGFIKVKIIIPDDLIYKTIRCLDYETTMNKSPSVNYVITLIALMWEYIDHKKYNLRKVVVKFLSRIGYPTSAIIADDNFDKDKCKFSNLESIMEHLLATLNQEHNSISVQEHNFLLTNFQKNIWDSMDTEKIIGISAPTSAGKSFVILLKLLDKLCKEKFDIIYIIPTLSLLNQVSEDFTKMLKTLNIKNCKVMNSFIDNKDNVNCIYVLTQEKAISALSDGKNKFNNSIVLVVDEIQNIERIIEDDDERAKILFDALNEFRYNEHVKQIIISGPRIDDISQTGKGIFGIETKDITSIDSPVLNLTYSIYKKENKYFFKQYCGLTEEPLIKEIADVSFIKGYGKKRYNDEYLGYLNNLVNKLQGQQNIIFSPTAATARNIATSLNDGTRLNIPQINELIKYYSETVHPDYSLCNTLNKGVAYHHGKLPNHVRKTLEIAIHNKWINNIACTTTLLQGVNLPAQNIIVRNPHLYLNRSENHAELSNYEMANLRGRAGRLLKDFIGRTFVLDESSFADTDGYDKNSLFDDVTKELPTSYGERYEKYKNDIETVIFDDAMPSKEMNNYSDLISYVRQSVLRYGENAVKRMRNVGIILSREQIAAIILKLNELSIPKEICYKNRYWDPFVLNSIYTKYKENVPSHPYERGARTKLDRMLKFLRDTDETNSMYEKYIPAPLRIGSNRSLLCDLCMLWAKETPLIEILSKKRYNKTDGISEQIEDTIRILQNIVAYKIPLLIKPIFDIINPQSSFVSCMQSGACTQIPKYLIEIGVPRECAFYIHNKLFKDYKVDGKNDYNIGDDVKKVICEHFEELPYWIQVQLEFMI